MKISKSLNNSVITFIGLENNQIDPAFSSSSSFSVIERIANSGAEVRYYDPNIPEITIETGTIHSEKSVQDSVKIAIAWCSFMKMSSLWNLISRS